MLEIEEYIMIIELHAQGFSITDISDKTGYDRKTVKKILNSETHSAQNEKTILPGLDPSLQRQD
ncbi:MAG: hypothetical protein ACNA7I_00175 [Candidatus Methanoperedens sp.]